MLFRQSGQFRAELEEAVFYYANIDRDLARDLLMELKKMEMFLGDFPDASPMTSEPPIRKFLMNRFPYRIRYSRGKGVIVLLTLENMHRNRLL